MSGPRCTCKGKVSPSAIATARACLRQWGWRYVAGVEDTPNPYAEQGTRLHAALERYYQDPHLPPRLDTSSDEGRILLPALAHLPPRGPHVASEVHFTRGPFHGFKDLEVRGWVFDLKTTSNLMFAKTPEDLRKDPQALIYAWDHLEAHPDLDAVTCRWVYVVRDPKRPRALPVDVTLTRSYVEAEIETLRALAADLLRHREARPHVLDLVPSPIECDRFRGCPHRDRCSDLTPERRIEAFMALQDMLARVGQINPTPPSTPAPATNDPPAEAPTGFYWVCPPGGAWQIFALGTPPPGPIPDGCHWVQELTPKGAVMVLRHPPPPPEPEPEPEPEPAPAPAPAPVKRGPGRPRKDASAAPSTVAVVEGSDAYAEGVRLLCGGLKTAIDGLEILLLGVRS